MGRAPPIFFGFDFSHGEAGKNRLGHLRGDDAGNFASVESPAENAPSRAPMAAAFRDVGRQILKSRLAVSDREVAGPALKRIICTAVDGPSKTTAPAGPTGRIARVDSRKV
jgi:hypothetical protein